LRALFAVDRDLAGKGMVRLAAEEVHDGRAQRGDRGRHQITTDGLQCRTAGEQDVAGVLGLIDHPPVAREAGGGDGGEQGIDLRRQAIEERRPVGVGEGLAQRRDRREVIDPGDLVVAAPVADPGPIHLPRQPLATVDVDLNLVGRPGLQAHVHPPELGIDQVQVRVQALARPVDHLQALCLPVRHDGERPAGLHHR
jgi:hypothetical protein